MLKALYIFVTYNHIHPRENEMKENEIEHVNL